MIWIHTKNKFLKGLTVLLIASQLAFGFSFLLAPKPAEAVFGVGDITFNWQVGNIWQEIKDIGLAFAERMALNYANKYLQKFVNQVIDKYRIKDYLAYDKVLSGYYLNQYIYKNVDDPDLRAIYGILATDINTRTTVTDPKTGQQIPVLAALKQKLDQYYYNQGGINTNLIYYPSGLSDQAYFQAAQAYFANPPSFTQSQLYGQFGQMVADSQVAAAQETAAGQGTKSDRTSPSTSSTGTSSSTSSTGTSPTSVTSNLPHVCSNFNAGPYQSDKNPRTSEANCTAAGGTWQVDASGTAMSVIQNPAAFIKGFADNAVQSIFTNNLHMGNNIYTMIGSLLGDYIFNKINLGSNQPGGVLNETSSAYVPDNTPVATAPTQVDLDGDGIPDVIRADGMPDSCIYGGVDDGSGNATIGPPCKGSKDALATPGPTTTPRADQTDAVTAVIADLTTKGVDLSGPCGAFEITKRVAWQLKDDSAGLLKNPGGINCSGYAIDIVAYPDGDNYTVLFDAGGANDPGWGQNNRVETSRYVPAIDPGL